MKKILYIIAGLALLVSCAKDTGNYDYTVLNTIHIDEIADCSVDQYDTLKIDPKFTCKFDTITDLSFEWRINQQLISTERNCRAYIEMPPATGTYGAIEAYDATFCITNNTNNLKYYKSFKVTIGTPYANALYVLSEKNDKQGDLSFRRMDRPNAPLVSNLFETINSDYGTLISPSQLTFPAVRGDAMILICKEGDNRFVRLSPIDMSVAGLYDISTIPGIDEKGFNPSCIKMYMGGMILSNGDLYGYNYQQNSTIYRPIEYEVDYELAWIDASLMFESSYWLGYDNKNEKFMSFEISTGSSMYFDKIDVIETLGISTQGQQFLGSGATGGIYQGDKRVILKDDSNTAYFYQLNITANEISMWESVPVLSFTHTMTVSGIVDKNSICTLAPNSKYWYISKGNKVIRLFADANTGVVDFFTAPQGEVVNMICDNEEERIFIATYDGTKGYIYTVSMLDANRGVVLEDPLQVDGKVVSMLKMGTWSF